MTLTDTDPRVASIIMAAGRGSRMKGYDGNKTLLPLVPGSSVFVGSHPILMHLMENLPAGPKALIVNHRKDEVMAITQGTGAVYCEQPVLNGTGGAILAAGEFVNARRVAHVIITMGDVPFVQKRTYRRLVDGLDTHDLMILGFSPENKKQYGMLEIEKRKVRKITEWKYWKDYPSDRAGFPDRLQLRHLCRAKIGPGELSTHFGIPTADRAKASQRQDDGHRRVLFYRPDRIHGQGRQAGRVHVVDDEFETMGIDDVAALEKAQAIYRDPTR